jgi:hypothetical protein
MERFEPEHWSGGPLNETVVLLNDVVEIFGLNDTDDSTDTGEFEDDI